MESINDRQGLLLKWYSEESSLILTVKEVQNRLGISNQTARTDLNYLSAQGFLHAIRVNLKKEAFIKSEKFDELIKQRLTGKQRSLF